MEEFCLASAQVLFTLADAVWRTEASKILRCKIDEPGLDGASEAKGDEGTLLRTAYEMRERARLRYEHVRAKLDC